MENKITGKTRKLGTKADFEKDVKEVAREAFTETLEKDHGKERTRKFVKEVFDKNDSWISKIADIFAYVVKIIKPDWYVAAKAASTLANAGYDIYKDIQSKKEIKEENKAEGKGYRMRGGHRRRTLNGFSSQKEKMAWVRSFIRKKRGSGYRKKHSKRKRYGKGV